MWGAGGLLLDLGMTGSQGKPCRYGVAIQMGGSG